MENESLGYTAPVQDSGLQTLIELQKKALRSGRIRTVLVAVFGALVLGAMGYLVFSFISAGEVLKVIETEIRAIDIDEINDTVAALEKAAENLTKVDIASINSTVRSLKEAAQTLSDVDISALNELVKSLQTTATALENVINGWNNIFHR